MGSIGNENGIGPFSDIMCEKVGTNSAHLHTLFLLFISPNRACVCALMLIVSLFRVSERVSAIIFCHLQRSK